MEKQTQPGDIPIGITNAVQAFALDLAGVLPGQPAVQNLYTRENLFDIGGGKRDAAGNVTQESRFKGMDIFAAAKAAFDSGNPGKVTYLFQRDPMLGDLCKAFTDQEQKLKTGDTVNITDMSQEITAAMVSGAMDQREGIVRLACLFTKTYVTYKHQWKWRTPSVVIPNEGPTKNFETTATTTDSRGLRKTVPAKGVSSPGFKVVSLNASEETKERLKL